MPVPNDNPESSTPLLELFSQAAMRGPWVLLRVGENGVEVCSTHSGVAGGRRQPRSRLDTTSAFLAALGDRYGAELEHAVSELLELRSAPGRPLRSRHVEQALAMTRHAATALDGVRFAARLGPDGGQPRPAGQPRDSPPAAPPRPPSPRRH